MKKISFALFLVLMCNVTFGQTNQKCACTPLTLNEAMKMKNMNVSDRQDYLVDNCYSIGRASGKQGELTFKEFTKCNLKKMQTSEQQDFFIGDYTIKLWSDNSVQYTTYIASNFQAIKKSVKSKGKLVSSDIKMDLYEFNDVTISFQVDTNKDGKTIHMIIFNF